jgi:ribosomal protein S18 acetylase RimI-like enzyme
VAELTDYFLYNHFMSSVEFALTEDNGDIKTYVVEHAHPGDEHGILEVHQTAFVQGYTNPDVPDTGATEEALKSFVYGEFSERRALYWERRVRDNPKGLYVARLTDGSDRVIGFGRAEGYEEQRTTELSSKYVHPDFQRKGVGTNILRALFADFSNPIIRLDVAQGTPAIHFYQKLGFAVTRNIVPPPKPPMEYGITLFQFEMVRQAA